MTKVVVDDLDGGQVSRLVEFLISVSSGLFGFLRRKSIEVTSLSCRRVKFLLRRFSHVDDLSELWRPR
jgi:hypothetical protein